MDKKKPIKFEKAEITDTDVLEGPDNSFSDIVRKAIRHGIAEGIKVNSIVINKKFVKTERLPLKLFGQVAELPPMICGLEASLTDDELPDDYLFAILEAPTERSELVEKTRKETAEEIYSHIDEHWFDTDMKTFIREFIKERYGAEVK